MVFPIHSGLDIKVVMSRVDVKVLKMDNWVRMFVPWSINNTLNRYNAGREEVRVGIPNSLVDRTKKESQISWIQKRVMEHDIVWIVSGISARDRGFSLLLFRHKDGGRDCAMGSRGIQTHASRLVSSSCWSGKWGRRVVSPSWTYE